MGERIPEKSTPCELTPEQGEMSYAQILSKREEYPAPHTIAPTVGAYMMSFDDLGEHMFSPPRPEPED